MIRKDGAYHDGQFAGKSAYVNEVRDGRVEYQDVDRWNYGWPVLGQRHSASLDNFKQQYPKEIDLSQF